MHLNNTFEKWEEKTLGEIAYIKGGKRLPKGEKLSTEKTNHPYIRVTDFNYRGTVDINNVQFITDDIYEQIKNYTISSSDLYISIAGTIGKSGIIPKELDGANLTENACKLVYKTKNISNRYVYYYTQTNLFKEQIFDKTKMAAMPKLALTRLATVKLSVPSLLEQERIVAKLDKALEAIDKVKSNAEQNLNNVKELFESALNKVFTENTEGWEEKTLKEVCKKISAGGDKPENFSKVITENCEVPIYSNGIENDGLYGYTDVPAITEEAITISARGTIGFICKRVKPYYPIVRLISAIPNDHINIDFMEYALKFMVPTGNGSSIPQLTVPMLKDKKVKYPSLPEQQKIVEKLDALQEQTKQLEAIYTQKIKECDELKQSILQKAFRGEL